MDADCIIIGAGIAGCMLFYELSKNTNQQILLLDADDIAAGITGLSGGFVDLQQTDQFNQQYAEYAYQYYQRLNDQYDIGFKTIQCCHVENNTEVYSNAMVINTDKLCLSLVAQGQQYGGNFLSGRQVQHLLIKHNVIYGIEGLNFSYAAKHFIFACGAHTVFLLPCYLANLVCKCFQFSIYENHSRLNHAVISLSDDFYIIPKSNDTLVCGFLSKDIVCNPCDNIMPDEKLDLKIHAMLNSYCPNFSLDKRLSSNVATDAFTENNEGLFGATHIAGLFVASGLGAHGITLTPKLVQQLLCKMII